MSIGILLGNVSGTMYTESQGGVGKRECRDASIECTQSEITVITQKKPENKSYKTSKMT
jgi:hypothetical protein